MRRSDWVRYRFPTAGSTRAAIWAVGGEHGNPSLTQTERFLSEKESCDLLVLIRVALIPRCKIACQAKNARGVPPFAEGYVSQATDFLRYFQFLKTGPPVPSLPCSHVDPFEIRTKLLTISLKFPQKPGM